jgi:hypothetical protein
MALSPERRRELLACVVERDGWLCWICGESIDPELEPGTTRSVSIDHVLPRSRGGTNSPANLGRRRHGRLPFNRTPCDCWPEEGAVSWQ